MNEKIRKAIYAAQSNGMTNYQLEEFLSQFKPKGRDLSNPYSCKPTLDAYNDIIDINLCGSLESAFELFVLSAKHILRNALDKERGDWRPNWSDRTQKKWMAMYLHPENDTNTLNIVDFAFLQYVPEWAYLPTKEAWKRVIEEIGEDCIKLALFEIEERGTRQ